MFSLPVILWIIVAYFIGNLNFAYIIVKLAKNEDIRNYGSGNAGTTNVLRAAGMKYAGPVFILDALKGTVVVLIGRMLFQNEWVAMAGVMAVVSGHNWPILLKYHGGKGTATTLGAMLLWDYKVALIAIAIGLIVLAVFKMVSLTSITGIGISPIITLIVHGLGNLPTLVLTIFIAMSSIFQHRTNIKRILSGTESKIGQKIKMDR